MATDKVEIWTKGIARLAYALAAVITACQTPKLADSLSVAVKNNNSNAQTVNCIQTFRTAIEKNADNPDALKDIATAIPLIESPSHEFKFSSDELDKKVRQAETAEQRIGILKEQFPMLWKASPKSTDPHKQEK